ncbi:hypothetical protein Tco_1466698, partial [Tanacetum coccineum]
KYVVDMLKKFDLTSVKTAITPMETKMVLTKDEEVDEVDVTPKTSHLNAVKRIFKYLKGKPNLGLWYPRESFFDLEAYSDIDYARANLDRKSTTSGCQFLGSRLISWQCKKQTIVATSTTEAEYVAAASCCGQVLWIQNQMLDYGFNFMNTKIYIDNESTICIVKNPMYHSKTKHIEIKHHFIQDSYEKKLIRVEKIHTYFNVADILTKAFVGPKFNFLVVNIVKQFWQTATASTLDDGTLELRATIDTLKYTITEASVRSKLQLANASGISMLSNTEIFEGICNMGYPADEERTMTVDDLLQLVPKLITKVDSLETEQKQTKLTMGKALMKLVKKGRNLQEEGEEDISPTTLKAAKTLSKVASQSGFEDNRTGFEDISIGFEEVNIGGLGVRTGSGSVSSGRGQREGKAPMIVEETQAPKRNKEQTQQEEASLAEATRLQTIEEEETAKQVHLDALLAKRLAEEEELTEQQKQRKAQSVLGKELPEEDFAKKMVELVNQRKKFFAEERAKARRKVKEEFDKLVKQVESFVPLNNEATKAQLKRYGEELHTEISKKQRIGDSETDKEESVEAMNPTHLDTKSNIVANWKIFQQGERSIYQIIRANRADTVYLSFGAMLKDFTREDLIELYWLVMQKYGTNRPEDAYDRVLWSDLRTMMYPLSKDACQVMLKMKLQDGKMNEVCYKLSKMIEKQAGNKELATPEQTATGKENSNPLIADSLLKTIRSPSSYNGIIGRPGLRKVQAVPSTAYGLLKFPVKRGIVTLCSNTITPAKCIMVAEAPSESLSNEQTTAEGIKIAIHLEYLKQTVMIGESLSKKGKMELWELLRSNLDIFT